MRNEEGFKPTDLTYIVPFVVAALIVAFWLYQGVVLKPEASATASQGNMRVSTSTSSNYGAKEPSEFSRAEEEKRVGEVAQETPYEAKVATSSQTSVADNDLWGKHKNYPADILSHNIHNYYDKLMSVNSTLSSIDRKTQLNNILEGKTYFRTILIPSRKYNSIDETVLEEYHALEWGTAIVDEAYFKIKEDSSTGKRVTHISDGLYRIDIILHSEFFPSRSKANGKTDLREDYLELTLLVSLSQGNVLSIEEHLRKGEPMLVTWEIDLDKSGVTKRYTTTSGVLVQIRSVVYSGIILEYLLLPNSHDMVVNTYKRLGEIEKFNRSKTQAYLEERERDLSHNPQVRADLVKLQEENARQVQLQVMKAENAPKAIADRYVNALISEGVVKSAVFTDYRDYAGNSISAGGGLQPGKKVYANYTVEYTTKGGFIKQGNVGILVYVDENFEWRYGETYFNGSERWTR